MIGYVIRRLLMVVPVMGIVTVVVFILSRVGPGVPWAKACAENRHTVPTMSPWTMLRMLFSSAISSRHFLRVFKAKSDTGKVQPRHRPASCSLERGHRSHHYICGGYLEEVRRRAWHRSGMNNARTMEGGIQQNRKTSLEKDNPRTVRRDTVLGLGEKPTNRTQQRIVRRAAWDCGGF